VVGRPLVDSPARSLATPLARTLAVCCGPIAVPLPLVAHRLAYVRDLDVSDREKRAPIAAASAVLAALGAIALLLDGAQATLTALAGAATAQGTLLALLTLREKVSYHAGGAGGLALAGWLLGGPPVGLALGALALATAWSRCYLGKHTPGQVGLGLLSSLALLLWLPP
jgi:membrane-associated phospholipid phosphatase